MKNIHQIYKKALLLSSCILVPVFASAQDVLYIYGDVAPNGNIPSGPNTKPFHQMRLNDTGKLGISIFRDVIKAEGYDIEEKYDESINMTASFLNNYDVIVFGLHQKIWSNNEKDALDDWLNAGGGMLIYSDSATGGNLGSVGGQNNVGQKAINNIITKYGLQVAVDQTNGTKSFKAIGQDQHPIVQGSLVLEGEGVSPVVVNKKNNNAKILIPHNKAANVGGNLKIPHKQGITIPAADRAFAAAAISEVGNGHVVAIFDRQPVWNDGKGSNIEMKDNKEILRRTIVFLAGSSSSDDDIVTIIKRNAKDFCIDGGGGSGTNGQNVRLFTFSNLGRQQWEEISRGNGFFSYKRKGTEHVLDGGNGGKNSQNVKLWKVSTNNQNQHWKKEAVGNTGFFRLRKRNANGFVIDGGVGGKDRQNVNLKANGNTNQNQHWDIQ